MSRSLIIIRLQECTRILSFNTGEEMILTIGLHQIQKTC